MLINNAIMLIISLCLNYFLMFKISPLYTHKRVLKICVVLLFLLVVCAMTVNGFTDLGFDYASPFALIYVSLVIIIFTTVANQLSAIIIGKIANFHQIYNVQNTEQFFLKLLITNQEKFKKNITIIWFLGSAIMLAGLYFGIHK